MYGIPKDLDLEHIIGAECNLIGIGQDILNINFTPEGTIGIEGSWEYLDKNEQIIDKYSRDEEKESYKLHGLLGKKISSYNILSNKELLIIFENGEKIKIFDDSDQYESFSIWQDIYI